MLVAVQLAQRNYSSLGALSLLTAILLGVDFAAVAAPDHTSKRSFTVADDIGLTQFSGSPIFSPNGKYFFVVSERGRLDVNRPESSVRIYLTEDVHNFLSQTEGTDEPLPFWVLTKSTYKNGPIIASIRWLEDSSGVAFLVKTGSGNDQLHLADVRTKAVEPLTPDDQHVTGFDVRSRGQFVYSVLSPTIREKAVEDSRAPAIVGTGRDLENLIFLEYSLRPNVWVHDLSELWAVLDGRRLRIMDPSSGQVVPIHLEGQRALALSHDGRSVVTALTVSSIPVGWERLYTSPLPSSPYRVRAGQQNPYALTGQRDVSEYVLINLPDGRIRPLTNAPIGNATGWWGISHADWSGSDQSVLLSNTFLPPGTHGLAEQANTPCVAVADLMTGKLTCVERLEEQPIRGRRFIEAANFARNDDNIVTIRYFGIDGASSGSAGFVRLSDGSWRADSRLRDSASKQRAIDVSVKQGLNQPSILTATDKKTAQNSRVIWDPNPQLKDIKLGDVSAFKWKDKTGREWVGGLYRPPDYVPGRQYPLVIQTHGFEEQEFRPSGASTTAFAAQELAAAGFLVLQVRDCPVRNTPEEGPCQIAGYEAAVEKLAADGFVDQDRIGIIGFSRTCYYVLEALTTSRLQFKAASITDGINQGYLQYILDIDGDSNNSVAREGDATIGAPPFGTGLQQWLRRSPNFNLNKVVAPLQVVATRPQILQMWEPYAALRYLKKPVDFLVLNSDEHVFTNPGVRMLSQSNTVDWFRFWLQDYEDRDAAKSEQYKRWKAIRALRDAPEVTKSDLR